MSKQSQQESTKVIAPKTRFEDGLIEFKYHGVNILTYKAIVPLSLTRKEVQSIKPKRFSISKASYTERLNKIANINVVDAPYVHAYNVESGNPYIYPLPPDPPLIVGVRRLGIGFSPAGNLVVTDRTMIVNFQTYFNRALYKKVSEVKNAGVPLATKHFCPLDPDAEIREDGSGIIAISNDKSKTYAFKMIESGIGMWIDLSHREIQDAYNDHIQRQQYAVPLVYGYCTRNVLRDHPAIGAYEVQVMDDGFAYVPVYGWKHDLTKRDIDNIIHKATSNQLNLDGVEVDSQTVTVEDSQAFDELESFEDEFKEGAETEDLSAGRESAEPDLNIPQNGNGNGKQTLFDTADDAIRDQIKNAAKIKGVDIDEFVQNEFKVAELSVLKGKSLDQCLEKLKG